MDKITRILLLYSKLIRGEPISKISFCMETESNERSFDRDIEDVRLYLAESFSTEEVLYDRANNCYVLSGIAKHDLEMTEYRFLERLLIQSELLRKDELIGLLTALASNTTRPKDCFKFIKTHTEDYPGYLSMPLLKMHDDISLMIENRSAIEIKYHDNDGTVNYYEIVPYDVEFSNGRMYLKAFDANTESRNTRFYLLERIESFESRTKISTKDNLKIEGIQEKNVNSKKRQKIKVEIECKNDFAELLKIKYKDAVHIGEDNGITTLYCDEEQFIEWILGQISDEYVILNPIETIEKISKRVFDLNQKYGKE